MARFIKTMLNEMLMEIPCALEGGWSNLFVRFLIGVLYACETVRSDRNLIMT